MDSSGNALWATLDRASGDDQMAVYERCGTTWNRSLLGSPGNNFTGSGLKVAPNGTAMAVWEADDASGTLTHYSSVRAPGGMWGAPQVIVADDAVDYVQFAMSDSGAAIALWADTSPVGTWASIRPAGGAWGLPEEIADTTLDRAVAMSASGDAVVVYRGPSPGDAWARFRPAGGLSWGDEVMVLDSSTQNEMRELMAEFDGTGQAVAMARFRELNDAIRVNVRGAGAAGAWGPTDKLLDDDGDQTQPNPPPPFDLRNLHALVRHPQGAVAVWTRRPNNQNFNDDIVVSRCRERPGTARPRSTSRIPSAARPRRPTPPARSSWRARCSSPRAAASTRSMRRSLRRSPGRGPRRRGSRPQQSPPSSTAIRSPVAAARTSTWHGGSTAPARSGTEIISTKPSGTCGGSPTPDSHRRSRPRRHPRAVATAASRGSRSDRRLPPYRRPRTRPPRARSRTSRRSPPPPSASSNRKLTLRLKRPPKGYTVKTVTVKVNGRRVATLKGSSSRSRCTCASCRTGTFTVEVAIKLKKGKGLTERRRYTACK